MSLDPTRYDATTPAHGYGAARAVAPVVHAHFREHLERARRDGEVNLAPLPQLEEVAQLIEATFWASLQREEGFVPKISLAFLAPEHSEQPLFLERPLPLEPRALTRIAPAVERRGIHLGVAPTPAGMMVWGTTRHIPKYCCVIEVAEPGLLVVKHHRGDEGGKFVNVVVLRGDQVKVVDESASSLPDCPSLVSSLLGFDSPASWTTSVNVLVQLSTSMRAHGRGGLMLVVPARAATWQESILQPITYSVTPSFRELAELTRALPTDSALSGWQEDLNKAIDMIAGLTAVDGAVVLNSDFELLAFGAKIARRRGSMPVERIAVTEPVQGGQAAIVTPDELGGTRHLSAAQFVHDQRNATALVASQDGRFTVFAWSPCEDMVHAHQVETLLL